MAAELCLHNATVLTGSSVMKKCAVHIVDGFISDVYNETRFRQKQFSAKVRIIDAKGAFLAPGFIDTHIHGIGGYDANDGTAKSILKMSEILCRYGVTSFVPTVAAAPEKETIAAVKAIVKAAGKEKGAKILGIHLEGPFLSPARIGGQMQNGLSQVDLALMERIWKASDGKIINMTVAPELKNMRQLALFCLKKGIVLQAGHTDATYDQMIEGMQAGIMHITHVFNAMRPLHHREPGVVGAALIHPELSCEIIGDGIHVNPHLLTLLMKCKPLNQLVLVTDSLKPSKTPSAETDELYFDKCFRRKSDNVIVGSGISMLDGFKNLVSWGIPVEKAIRIASANPARVMKQERKGLIMPGYEADIIVFNKKFEILHTIINGRLIKED